MENLKQEAINVISKMPDTAEIDDIMYRLYMIDKIRKGKEAVQLGEVVSIEDLKKEGSISLKVFLKACEEINIEPNSSFSS